MARSPRLLFARSPSRSVPAATRVIRRPPRPPRSRRRRRPPRHRRRRGRRRRRPTHRPPPEPRPPHRPRPRRRARRSSPTTTSVAPTSAVVPSAVPLRTDGFSGVAFGTDAETAIAAFTAELGAPSEDTGWVEPLSISTCGGTQARRLSWGALSMLFGDQSPVRAGLAALPRVVLRHGGRHRCRADRSRHGPGHRPR